MENYLYYIFEDMISSELISATGKTKIFAIPIELLIIMPKEGEGPFTSIRNLKRNSVIFKQIARRSSKLANHILEEKNIVKIKNFTITKHEEVFPKDFISLLDHTVRGQIQKRQVYGIHYFDKSLMRINEIIMSKNDKGIWNAKIDLFDKRKNQWIPKEQKTSFFPVEWSMHQLFHECYYAYKNMIKDESKKYTYLSETESGVKVKIIVKGDQVKSIYPIY